MEELLEELVVEPVPDFAERAVPMPESAESAVIVQKVEVLSGLAV